MPSAIRRRTALLVAIAPAVPLSACLQTTPIVASASGKPEITLRGSVAKNVTALIVSEMINDPEFRKDYPPVGRTETTATFEKFQKGTGSMDPDQRLRITFDALELGDTTRVVANYTRQIGTSAPSNYLYGYRQLQAWLDKLKAKMQP